MGIITGIAKKAALAARKAKAAKYKKSPEAIAAAKKAEARNAAEALRDQKLAKKNKVMLAKQRKANATKFKNSPRGKAAAARAEAEAAATPTAKKLKFGYSKKNKPKPKPKAAAVGGGKKPPNGGKIPVYSAGNISSYKEAIMIKEGLNTWPSTRDPFPKSKAEFKVWDKVGSYKN